MTFEEAYNSAKAANKDLVLRNPREDPPVVKVMNYKMELLKKLFKKLGRQVNEREEKGKSLRLATTISAHDL